MVILIPCYNEASRLPVDSFTVFLENTGGVTIIFINDGSKDDTLKVLNLIQLKFPDKVLVLDLVNNKGKAQAINDGVKYAVNTSKDNVFAYLDADLATSLEECFSYRKYILDGKKFVFASRILKIGSIVERKYHRFLFGRIIATFISNILQIKVYDTQCGCKVFDREIAELAFNKPFISKWLFDVEIFSRILKHYGKENALGYMEEIPVKKWVDRGDSKVKLSYFFRLWIDLIKIRNEHHK